MNLTGHNSYKGCRYCDIRDIYINYIYFPMTLLIGKEECEVYDPKNLPLRTYKQFKYCIHQLNQAFTSKKKDELIIQFGMLFLIYRLYKLI